MGDPAAAVPISGRATRAGTRAYEAGFGHSFPDGHFTDVLPERLRLSSLGLGTFPGAADDATDDACARIVRDALLGGVNVVDTAAHYRYGRAPRAVGWGIRLALEAGVARDQFLVVAKGGFLLFEDGIPADFDSWFSRHVEQTGLGTREDLTGRHLLTPQYIEWQIERVRALTGLETLDVFMIDQPEVHVPRIGQEAMHRRIGAAFVVCEQAVRSGRIRSYGVSTFAALRVATDVPGFPSIAALVGLAEQASRVVHGNTARGHGLILLQAPFNPAMPEVFTRFGQATGQGNVASAIQAAHQLGLAFMASHGLAKGVLARDCPAAIVRSMPCLANHAQRALQFVRSTPGVAVGLVGVSTPSHLADLLEVARTPPMPRADWLALWRRAE